MRRLETKIESEKRRKRIVSILSTFMLSIMVLSVLGFSFLSNTGDSSNEEGNPNQGQLKIDYGGQTIYLMSTQEDIENISININILPQIYFGKTLYIVSENQGILQEIASTIGLFSSRVQEACHGPCEKNLPERNCTDNLIIWKESEENKVSKEDNCIFIEGDLRTVDAFIYNLFS